MEITVECQKRPEGSKPNALRRQGLIPAVLYGHNGTESIPLTINAKNVEALMKKASINNTLIQLNISDLSWNGKTLLREVQKHPWRGFTYHLSFFAVSAQDTVDVEVPLHFVGEPIGVRLEGGVLDPVLTQLAVQCRADSIPEAINVDISELHVGDILHVSELSFPEGVTAVGEADRVVITVVRSKTESEATEGEPAA